MFITEWAKRYIDVLCVMKWIIVVFLTSLLWNQAQIHVFVSLASLTKEKNTTNLKSTWTNKITSHSYHVELNLKRCILSNGVITIKPARRTLQFSIENIFQVPGACYYTVGPIAHLYRHDPCGLLWRPIHVLLFNSNSSMYEI